MHGFRSCQTRVRFGHTDRYGYTWHGHLAAFFEEARSEFSRAYGLSTSWLLENDTSIPMTEFHGYFLAPSYEEDVLSIQYTLLEPRIRLPVLLFVYRVFRQEPSWREVARGYTRQQIASRSGVARVRVNSEVARGLKGAWTELRDLPRWADGARLLGELWLPQTTCSAELRGAPMGDVRA